MSDLLNNPISFNDLAIEFATSGVYAIYCQHTDTYYIGQATVVLRRLVDHFTYLRAGNHHNTLMQQEFNGVGEDQFVMGLLVDMPQAEAADLLRRETAEIQRFKAHGKRLYNKVMETVRVLPPNSREAEPRPANPDRPRNPGNPYLSHAERVDSSNELIPVACYDCGTAGLSQIDIFKCDDGHSRCQMCIEMYLDKWRPAAIQKPSTHMPSAIRKGSYRRWLVPDDAAIQEHIVLAANNFANRFGYMPTQIFVSPSLDAPDEYRGIKIEHGGIAVGRYIDIPIGNPHGQL